MKEGRKEEIEKTWQGERKSWSGGGQREGVKWQRSEEGKDVRGMEGDEEERKNEKKRGHKRKRRRRNNGRGERRTKRRGNTRNGRSNNGRKRDGEDKVMKEKKENIEVEKI